MSDKQKYTVYDSYDPLTNTYSDNFTILDESALYGREKDGIVIIDTPPNITDTALFSTSIAMIVVYVIAYAIIYLYNRTINEITFNTTQSWIIGLIVMFLFIFLILSCVFNGKKIFRDKIYYYKKQEEPNYIYKNTFKQNSTSAAFFGVSVTIAGIIVGFIIVKYGNRNY